MPGMAKRKRTLAMPELIKLLPQYSARVWGGQRLQPTAPGETPIGELWAVFENNIIANGELAGKTLAEATTLLGSQLLGARVVANTGLRFPLLIKLLDCADWLSIQVHPNDEQARQLEGAGQFGKTEAWHILHAAPNAQLIAGVKTGVTQSLLVSAILHGGIRECVQYIHSRAGDTLLMRAGTIHAIGPGLLLYEVQQTSDITYRVYDWERPASAGRGLHLAQSAQVARAIASPEITRTAQSDNPGAVGLTSCEYFSLQRITCDGVYTANTSGDTFHVVTVTIGEISIQAGQQTEHLRQYESILIPAAIGEYRLFSNAKAQALLASAC